METQLKVKVLVKPCPKCKLPNRKYNNYCILCGSDIKSVEPIGQASLL